MDEDLAGFRWVGVDRGLSRDASGCEDEPPFTSDFEGAMFELVELLDIDEQNFGRPLRSTVRQFLARRALSMGGEFEELGDRAWLVYHSLLDAAAVRGAQQKEQDRVLDHANEYE